MRSWPAPSISADSTNPSGIVVLKNVLQMMTLKEETAKAAEAEAAEKAGFEATSWSTDHPYGEGSHAPLDDGSAPEGFTIKGNADSMKYHTPESQWYDQTVAEVWFATTEAAEAAGFVSPGSASDD